MKTMQLTESKTLPAGTLETACGFVLPDCPRSRLNAILHDAYELTDRVAVRVDDETPYELTLGRDMIEAEPTSLGEVDLGTPATMTIEQVDANTFRLTEVLEEWMGEPRVRMLQVTYEDPRKEYEASQAR